MPAVPGSDAEDELTVQGFADALDIYTGYLPSLRAHLRDTRAHLAGSIPPNDSVSLVFPTESTSTLNIEESPDLRKRESKPTIWHSSLSSWSQSEVDAFFHAVSVYSRWRPDLIADDVKTKGEVEVVEFLTTLDSCVHPRATEANLDIREILSVPPAAIEVSEKWVAAEDAMAAAIAAKEDLGELEELEALRRKRVRDARADMIPRGKRRRIAAGVREDKPVVVEHSERDVESMGVEIAGAGKAHFKNWHARNIATWEREDLLTKLEDVHWQVLDAILREDEEIQKEKSLNREGSADVISQESDTGLDLKILSPTSRRRLTKRLYMRRMRAQLRGEDVAQAREAPMGLVRLKPGRK